MGGGVSWEGKVNGVRRQVEERSAGKGRGAGKRMKKEGAKKEKRQGRNGERKE